MSHGERWWATKYGQRFSRWLEWAGTREMEDRWRRLHGSLPRGYECIVREPSLVLVEVER